MRGTTGGPSALSLLREAIAALARADTAGLEGLEAQAGGAMLPAGERTAAAEQYRTLGLLLELTGRNLRLLRGEPAGCYGGRRSRG